MKFTAAPVAAATPSTASFTITPPEAQVGDTVTFNGSGSADPAGKPLTYAWDFGDGAHAAASSSATATHAYAAAASYTVTLTVSDGTLGATATGSVTVKAVVTGGGSPTLTVSVPGAATNALDFGDLNGNKNIAVWAPAFTVGTPPEMYPAWVEKCVEITNTGMGTLSISSVSIDNTAAFQVRNAANVTAKTLAAGEIDFIDVRFNTRPYTTGSTTAPAPGTPGPQVGILTIVTNDTSATGTQHVSLTGNVVSDVSAGAIRLMRSDIQRTPDDSASAGVFGPVPHQPGNASVLDMGPVASTQSFLLGGLVNEGDAAGTVTGVDVFNDQGQTSPDFSAQLVHSREFSVSGETAIAMASGASLENYAIDPVTSTFLADFIQVTFHPTNMTPQQRLSARMIVHTDSGDQVVGLTGIGVDGPYYSLRGGDFEFTRTSPGVPISTLYERADNLSPATLTVVNIGRKSGTITAAVAGINGGAATGFSVSPASLTLGPTGSGTFTLTFTPSAAQHYAGSLTVNPGVPYEPAQAYLLHGYGIGGVGMLGTSLNWYSYDGSSFNNTEMVALGNTGVQSNFSQIDGIPDPFQAGSSGNTVGMNEYSNPDWSALVMYNNGTGGKEYTIDGAVFGPYALGAPGEVLTTQAIARLQAGQPIYSGGIESHGAFVAGIDGHLDIQSDPTTNDTFPGGVTRNGIDPIRLDVTPDGILFYTSVASNLTSAPTPVITTSLKWENLHAGTGGVVAADVVAALGGAVPANEEVLDMRVIKLATGGYRVFFVFDDSDAAGNQMVADMDLSSGFAPTGAHKTLTGTLSALSNANAAANANNGTAPSGNQPLIIDAKGLSYTSATVQNTDGTATMKVFREDLHAGTGATTGPALFGSVTVNFGDADGGQVLLDNQGNVFLMTNDGICAFSPTGAFVNYILESQTYYANNFIGSTSSGTDTQDLSDFNAVWMDK